MTLPHTVEELAALQAEANGRSQSITLCGNSSKIGMGGTIAASDLTISTAKLNRVLQYEPRDLTISVEAGITYGELSRILAEHRQMIPLDPPFSDRATIGGIVATNASGPRRRLYGTARDMVIGMTFATMEGKLIKSGGMVVKNVAGLDMGKLMIGSFGTLAAICVVNFRLHPMPAATRTFVQRFVGVAEALAARDAVLKSALQPAAIDLVRDAEGYELLIQAGGSRAVLDRYSRELAGATVVEGEEEVALWNGVREFTPQFLREHAEGAVVRVSCGLSEVGRVMESLPVPSVARAASGVCYGYFADAREAVRKGVIEFAPAGVRESTELWPEPGSDFAMMKKIKEMFDPHGLLNRGRLYGRL
ncbi:MAG TPA: FAD-binding oxidoreductase [Bryobacteraceae bacterium]|nr:FAD-binding oxidoreductase [Bryobacteraceae bacterium]